MHFVDIPVIANSFGRKMEQPKSPITEPTHTQPRSQLNGSQILNRIINPTMARSIVPAVEMSVSPSPNVCPKTAMAATASTARALITKPAIVLADEPTGNLDSKTSTEVLGLIKRTSAEFRQTVVMITHNNDIARLADRIVRIEDGKIVE